MSSKVAPRAIQPARAQTLPREPCSRAGRTLRRGRLHPRRRSAEGLPGLLERLSATRTGQKRWAHPQKARQLQQVSRHQKRSLLIGGILHRREGHLGHGEEPRHLQLWLDAAICGLRHHRGRSEADRVSQDPLVTAQKPGLTDDVQVLAPSEGDLNAIEQLQAGRMSGGGLARPFAMASRALPEASIRCRMRSDSPSLILRRTTTWASRVLSAIGPKLV